TNLTPSAMITSPSFPDCAACSVRTTCPSGAKVMTSVVPMLTTTILPSPSTSMPLGMLSGAPCTNTDAWPSGESFHTCQVSGRSAAPVLVPYTVPSAATVMSFSQGDPGTVTDLSGRPVATS